MKKRKYSLAHPIKFWLGKKNPYNTGKNNNHWNGGITRRHGYILILSKNHPNKNYENYVWEHRLIVEKIIGRYLLPDERVHHINGIRDDNRTKNLYLFSTNGEHACFHGLKNKSILKSNLSQKSICR